LTFLLVDEVTFWFLTLSLICFLHHSLVVLGSSCPQ